MSTNSLTSMEGHIFEPALQDISLKRFRMRYCSFNNCYYLLWDNPVCKPLAKLYGLEEGLFRASGVQRYEEGEEDKLTYLSCEEGSTQGTLEWVLDFSCCGLVVHQLAIRARCSYGNEDRVSCRIQGDDSVSVSPILGDQHVNLDCLSGCSRVSIAMNFEPSANRSVRLLPSFQNDEAPLDIIVDLMCPRKVDEMYAGELLLGIKYTSGDQLSSQSDLESASTTSLASDGIDGAGHLQVHIVEGAGIVDDETHKPFNTFAKCDILPCISKHGNKQTSPKHNAYPTWAAQFNFEGLSRRDIMNGGLEVILYDHHKFSHDHNIGGLRMCMPQLKAVPLLPSNPASPLSSPSLSRTSSPAPPDIVNGSPYDSDGSLSPLSPLSNLLSEIHISDTTVTTSSPPLPSSLVTDIHISDSPPPPKTATTLPRSLNRQSLPNSISMNAVSSSSHLSPEVLRRAPSPDIRSRSASTLSPHIIRRSASNSAVKSKFRLSGSHLINLFSPSTSPRSSPIGRRKLFSRNNSIESEYVHWWMEDTPTTEVRHWKQVLGKDGEWVYFWHLIRPKLKSAC